MAGQNDFLIFDENKDNMLTQELYSVDGDRTDGFKKGLARSNVNNKVLHQTSMMCNAIGELAKEQGLVASDEGSIENLKSVVKQALGGANKDLDNLTETGEKHFLNKSQITNCLLEVPQRIKYTLVDGVLTILKGSVCIVPYGTEDKTADLPKGATFINENFKVYDTQFSDGKFFVWAELVNDTPSVGQTVSDVLQRTIFINLSTNSMGDYITNRQASGDNPTATENFTGVYNTSTNLVGYSGASTNISYSNVLSLPLLITNVVNSQIYGSIQQVFNGMGYVGSTVWVDKGVKGVSANGKEVITDKLTLTTITDTVTRNRNININENGVWTNADMFTYYQSTPPDIDKSNYQLWFKEDEKIVYEHLINADKWTVLEDIYLQAGICGWDSSSKRVTSFTPKFPLRVTDYNDIDGKWVRQSLLIINSETAFPLGSQQYRDYDISNYLPNDGHIYEVAIEILAFSGSATNATSHWWISNTIDAFQSCSCGGRAYSNARDQQYANGIQVVPDRILRLYCSSTEKAPTISVLRLCGYRKVR